MTLSPLPFLRQFKTIPRRRWPCVSNTSYSSSQCISRCFLTALYAHTQCLMPYMHGESTAKL